MNMRILIFLALIACSAISLQAQDDYVDSPDSTKVYAVVKPKDGKAIKGEVISEDSKTIVLRTSGGEVELLKTSIKSIEYFDELDLENEFTFPNPSPSRYLFGPSAIPLEKGTGYYQNVMVLVNSFAYGITDNITIGGGFEFLSTIVFGNPVWLVTPKVGFKTGEKFHVGGGALVIGMADAGVSTLLYGTTTFGSKESNVSISGGYGLVDGEFADYPVISISGMTRLNDGLSLVSENYMFPTGKSEVINLNSFGVRLFSPNNSFDIAVVSSFNIIGEGADILPVLPWISYVRTF